MTPAQIETTRAAHLDRAVMLGAIVEVLPYTAAPPTGALAGVSLAIKDMVDLRGRVPGMGLQTASSRVPSRDATVVRDLANAGMDLAAITEMTPLAFEPSGGNPWRGRPRNPWNADYVCGGSSSGSAVAVAVDSVRVALGSDTAGSLRIPAHCCGVTAWKPTNGVVPTNGTMALAPTLDTLGFLARAASDLVSVADLFTSRGRSISTALIARDLLPFVAEDTKAAMADFEAAIAALGLAVESVDIGNLLKACDDDVMTLLQGEAARESAAIAANGQLDPTLAKRLSKGHAVSDAMLADARARLTRLAADAEASLFAKTAALVLPVMPIVTPRVTVCEPSSSDFSARTLYQLSAFTRFVNGLGWPALAVPIGFDTRGLPIGCQIVGPPGSDSALLELAARVQETTDWHLRMADGVTLNDGTAA